jgi:hypothetical protein
MVVALDTGGWPPEGCDTPKIAGRPPYSRGTPQSSRLPEKKPWIKEDARWKAVTPKTQEDARQEDCDTPSFAGCPPTSCDTPQVVQAARKTALDSRRTPAGNRKELATPSLCSCDTSETSTAGGPIPTEEIYMKHENKKKGQAKAAVSSFIELEPPGEGSPSRGSTYHKGVARPLPGMDFPPAQDQGHDGARQSP